MPCYFFHLRDHIDEILDEEGFELADLNAVKVRALHEARAIMGSDVLIGILDLRYRIDVEDGSGKVLYSMPFQHAVQIIPE